MVQECKRCLLHVGVPGVRIDDDGICTVCHDHDRKWGNWEELRAVRRHQLEQLFARFKNMKRPYDALVPLSGGKDSSWVLYQCARVYGLKCLAVTWDNGFLSDSAKLNIKTVVDALGVDHLFYRVSWPRLRHLYGLFFRKTGMFCPVCMRGIGVATAAAAESFNIPLVVNGTCLRHEEYVSSHFFTSGPVSFFDEVMKGEDGRDLYANFCYQGSALRKVSYYVFWWTKTHLLPRYAAIELPDYLDWDYEQIIKTLREKVGWISSKETSEHDDCIMAPLVGDMRWRKFPALAPGLLRYSKLVTSGVLAREEAKIKVMQEAEQEALSEEKIAELLSIIGITPQEFEAAMADPLRHQQYLKEEHGRVFRAVRRVKRYLFRQHAR